MQVRLLDMKGGHMNVNMSAQHFIAFRCVRGASHVKHSARQSGVSVYLILWAASRGFHRCRSESSMFFTASLFRAGRSHLGRTKRVSSSHVEFFFHGESRPKQRLFLAGMSRLVSSALLFCTASLFLAGRIFPVSF